MPSLADRLQNYLVKGDFDKWTEWIWHVDPHAGVQHKKGKVHVRFTDGSMLTVNASGSNLDVKDFGAEMLSRIRKKREPPKTKPDQYATIADWFTGDHPPQRLYRPIHYQVWCALCDPTAVITLDTEAMTIQFSDGSTVTMTVAAGYQ